jgi:hypothetical protein
MDISDAETDTIVNDLYQRQTFIIESTAQWQNYYIPLFKKYTGGIFYNACLQLYHPLVGGAHFRPRQWLPEGDDNDYTRSPTNDVDLLDWDPETNAPKLQILIFSRRISAPQVEFHEDRREDIIRLYEQWQEDLAERFKLLVQLVACGFINSYVHPILGELFSSVGRANLSTYSLVALNKWKMQILAYPRNNPEVSTKSQVFTYRLIDTWDLRNQGELSIQFNQYKQIASHWRLTNHRNNFNAPWTADRSFIEFCKIVFTLIPFGVQDYQINMVVNHNAVGSDLPEVFEPPSSNYQPGSNLASVTIFTWNINEVGQAEPPPVRNDTMRDFHRIAMIRIERPLYQPMTTPLSQLINYFAYQNNLYGGVPMFVPGMRTALGRRTVDIDEEAPASPRAGPSRLFSNRRRFGHGAPPLTDSIDDFVSTMSVPSNEENISIHYSDLCRMCNDFINYTF